MEKLVAINMDEDLIRRVEEARPEGTKKGYHYCSLLEDGLLYRTLENEPRNEKKLRGME